VKSGTSALTEEDLGELLEGYQENSSGKSQTLGLKGNIGWGGAQLYGRIEKMVMAILLEEKKLWEKKQRRTKDGESW